MKPTLFAPDVIAAVVPHLVDVLNVPVSSKVPNPRPDRFVTVRETGGAGRQDTVLYRASVQYFGWAETDQDARSLTAQARTALLGMANGSFGDVQIFAVREVGAVGWFPDPDSGQARFVGSVEIIARET